jgi:tetratricopeptide (TPR) repeat protein
MLNLSGDNAGALTVSERLVQLEPQWHGAHNNLGAYLASAGRWAEALDSYKAAERVALFGPNQIILANQCDALLVLGRVSEARLLAPRITGPAFFYVPMRVAMGAGEWSVAESLARVLQSHPTPYADAREGPAWTLAAVQFSRGEVLAAGQTLRQKQAEAEASNETSVANSAAWRRVMLTLFARGVAAHPGDPGGWDSTTAGLITHGVWAAAAGDTTLARRLLATIRTRSARDLARQGFTPAVLEAWIAARTGHWQDALRVIGPAALQGEAVGLLRFQSAPLVRWLAAEAYERLDRPDSAAAYFERACAPPPVGGSDIIMSRMAYSFGQRRLVLLYARMGRLEEARRCWESFSSTFTRPDPEMAPLIAEARAVLASAEGMAKSARR